MIEALIALPVMLALLFGVSFMRELHAGKQAALADARRCALLHAASGCGAEPPDDCEGSIGTGPNVSDDGKTAAVVDATRTAYAGSKFQLLEKVPALDHALSALFGTTTQATAQRSVRTPGAPAESRVLTASMALLCNERETDVLNAAKEAACAGAGLDKVDILQLCEGP